jgi:hypothetical protein
MRKSILIPLILILTNILSGQIIKISIAPTINAGLYYQISVLGGPGQNIKPGLITSLDYLLINDKRINFGFGLNYHYCQVEFVPNLNNPDLPLHSENINLISARFKTVYKLKNQYYLSIDPTLDFQLHYDSQQTLDRQSGFGLSFGVGKNIQLKETVFLNIEPRLWIHNIIPFGELKHGYHLTALGINIGLAFNPE